MELGDYIEAVSRNTKFSKALGPRSEAASGSLLYHTMFLITGPTYNPPTYDQPSTGCLDLHCSWYDGRCVRSVSLNANV